MVRHGETEWNADGRLQVFFSFLNMSNLTSDKSVSNSFWVIVVVGLIVSFGIAI